MCVVHFEIIVYLNKDPPANTRWLGAIFDLLYTMQDGFNVRLDDADRTVLKAFRGRVVVEVV